MNTQEICQQVVPIARKAGEMALSYFRRPITQSIKSTAIDLVTEADQAVENYITGELLRLFPEHHLVGEEGGGQGSPYEEASYRWYIDPIDGTVNFANGIGHFCVSLALTDQQNQPLVGIIYDPNQDELFIARKGQGATVNDQPLAVSTTQELLQAILFTGFPYDRHTNPDNNLAQWQDFIFKVRALRVSGSAALDLAYVASGRAEGFWERNINPWDILAGRLLIEEAGGMMTDYTGAAQPILNAEGRYIASNGHLHTAMQETIQQAYA